jgi:DNA-binding NtrC family response regulator
MAGPILLVEDTPGLRHLYAALLRKAGHVVESAETAAEALAAHAAGRHEVVLLDLMLPDGDGIDVLRAMRRDMPDLRAVVITAHGSVNRAVDAMRAGAHDFLVKPFDENRLLRAVEAALAAGGAARAAPAPADPGAPAGFIGAAPAMLAIYDMIRDVARSSATVFITGESGTGKEVCAQAVHALSPRRAGPFVPLNCGAIPRDLLESEVFGHVKGSFTGAIADKVGAAAAADHGTLFLDEICEMDLDLQTKLLRFLQTSTIQPVGVVTPRKVDVRIVCATNREPEAEVAAGRFRADLFYRLFVVPVRLPPLRARGRDVLAIAERLLADYAREEGKRFRRLDAAVEDAFLRYGWPGNIRELQNVMRQIVVLKDGEAVTLDMLPERVIDGRRDAPAPAAGPRAEETSPAAPDPDAYETHLRALVGTPLDRVERDFIEATIALCDGSIPRAARLLEVSPSTLYRKREAWMKR